MPSPFFICILLFWSQFLTEPCCLLEPKDMQSGTEHRARSPACPTRGEGTRDLLWWSHLSSSNTPIARSVGGLARSGPEPPSNRCFVYVLEKKKTTKTTGEDGSKPSMLITGASEVALINCVKLYQLLCCLLKLVV